MNQLRNNIPPPHAYNSRNSPFKTPKSFYKKKIYDRYFYFTIINNKKVKVINPNIFQSLGTNDQVKIKGHKDKYRVTINEDRIPEYPRVE